MKFEDKNQRREFIKKSSLTLAAFNILPALSFGGNIINHENTAGSPAVFNATDTQSGHINIIPAPVAIKTNTGFFNLTHDVGIVASNNKVMEIARRFVEQIATPTGFNLKVNTTAPKSRKIIELSINTTTNNAIGAEGYTLNVTATHIHIKANQPAGIFYGLQSLMQLLPADIEQKANAETTKWLIPCASVTDYPGFGWRGLLLDVARHFFSIATIKEYIDQMVKYKYNILHLHLSDDQGWRVEIKSLPQLTKVGAWRVPRTGRFGTFEPAQPGEKATYGGYYTHEDIKDLVKYAQDRFVTILPEIDVPGHCHGLISSYPQTSCTQVAAPVLADVKKGNEDNVLCAGNEEVLTILDKIFTEIAELFPCEYIHVGGDEVDKMFWKACPKCQKRIADEHLKDEEELQSYFMKRVQKIITAKNKKMIGWDEILQGGVADDAVVMSWRGTKGGVDASNAGHYVIMSPNSFAYFDRLQGDFSIERVGGPGVKLSQTYKFAPLAIPGINGKYILGGEGTLWTEFIANKRRLDYQTWPRALALAEVLWSPAQNRNWNDFVRRMEANFVRFKKADINYSPSVYDAMVIPVANKEGKAQVTFSTDIDDLDVYYTFDYTFPDAFAAKYEHQPIDIPTGATDMWAITYRDGKVAGRLLTITVDEINKRLKKPRYNTYF